MMSTGHRITFLSMIDTDARDGLLGAVLVTDPLGRPLEFRVTLPVKPTRVQQQLYGESLRPYVGVELCGKPLLDKLDNEPSIVLVNEEYLLGVRPGISYPVAAIRRVGEAIEVSSSRATNHTARQTVVSASGKFQPVNILFHPNFSADADQVRPRLDEMFAIVDLLEPFSRIENAVKVLALEDERFR